MAVDDDLDDVPQLSSDTLALLKEFHAEKDARAKHFENLKAQAERDFENSDGHLDMDLFGEDWQVSQFWYTEDTARTLAYQLLEDATAETSIAIVSAPSVYVALRNILADDPDRPKPTVNLLEYDRRFEFVGQDFIYYDFEQALRLPPELKGKFDRIICDPPFLSEDCQTKTALTVRLLAKSWVSAQARREGLRLISCTGERMEAAMLKLYGKVGMKTTTFEPEHSKGLSNEFRCYANFECEAWKWR